MRCYNPSAHSAFLAHSAGVLSGVEAEPLFQHRQDPLCCCKLNYLKQTSEVLLVSGKTFSSLSFSPPVFQVGIFCGVTTKPTTTLVKMLLCCLSGRELHKWCGGRLVGELGRWRPNHQEPEHSLQLL